MKCDGDCAHCRPAIEDGGECPLQWDDDFLNPFNVCFEGVDE